MGKTRIAVLSYLYTVGAFCVFGFLSAQNVPYSNFLSGENTYISYCAPCHGVRGDGHSPAARAMSPSPRDFSSGLYKFRSTLSGSLPTDDDLILSISNGLPGTWMPSWKGVLSDEQIEDVTAYIKTLLNSEQKWKQSESLPSLSYNPPLASSELLRDGRGFYLLLECWTCHGLDGKGNGPSAMALKDSKNKPIKPTNLTEKKYRAGTSVTNIRKTILTGLTGTPMPSYKDLFLLAKEDINEIEFSKDLPHSSREIFHSFVSQLPSNTELNSLTEEMITELSIRNEWALAYYVRSLIKKESWYDWLFRSNPEDVQLSE
ncbi:MAG: cytochrome c [Fidelibacterota bacterium]